jgi:DNA adenine methylase
MEYRLKSPFPWFGGKSRVADEIWRRFGDVPNYVEPFAGSLAVLLQRPHEAKTETVNDIDCYLSNFWRALSAEPEAVAQWADYPVNEADLHSRHLWLLNRVEFREHMKTDPDYYDCKIAGWWVWGICQWIGSGWCHSDCYAGDPSQRHPSQQLPHLGDAGRGIHRPSQKLPHLGNAGMGIHRPSQKLPHLGNAGMGDNLYEYLYALADRLRRIRVACGDWTRVTGDSVTFRHGITGVLLDPPYSHEKRQDDLYANDNDVAAEVREWALASGDNPKLRIALCGYLGEHDMEGWTLYQWKARGGYGSQGNGTGRENAERECIWFSPHCLHDRAQRRGRATDLADLPLFA